MRILSGVFEGLTTGTPIALQIDNVDQRSKDYGDIAEQFRPGHADLTYELKYGIRDYRGGGRVLGPRDRHAGGRRRGGAAGAGRRGAHPRRPGADRPARHRPRPLGLGRRWTPIRSSAPTPSPRPTWEDYLDGVRKAGSSCGAVVEVVAEGVPPGLGAPIYGKLDADLAAALMGINAVKGVEIGDGFAAAALSGEAERRRDAHAGRRRWPSRSNHAGGILGGISTGQPMVARFAVKPTSSILTPRARSTGTGSEVEVVTKGRHDPCVGIRAVPVGEAMLAWLARKVIFPSCMRISSAFASPLSAAAAKPSPISTPFTAFDAHQRGGEVGVELGIDRRTQAGRHALGHHFTTAPQEEPAFAESSRNASHSAAAVRVGAEERIVSISAQSQRARSIRAGQAAPVRRGCRRPPRTLRATAPAATRRPSRGPNRPPPRSRGCRISARSHVGVARPESRGDLAVVLRALVTLSICNAIGVPVVLPSNTPDRMHQVGSGAGW